ncbi:MAG: adenylate/guanylate cyclase domain-containing protein [Pseudomonadota bacterium]
MEFRRALHAGASEERLAQLMQERSAPNADRAVIDQRIWDLFGERWAVMFTDLSGFSRQVAEFGIVHFLQVLYSAEQLLMPIIAAHDGVLLKVEGDSYLVIFRKPAKALAAALDMQERLRAWNEGLAGEDQVLLCVGLGFGDMLRIGDRDVFGEEVNAASKLGEDTAQAYEILVTEALRETAAAEPRVTGIVPLTEPPKAVPAAYRLDYT